MVWREGGSGEGGKRRTRKEEMMEGMMEEGEDRKGEKWIWVNLDGNLEGIRGPL